MQTDIRFNALDNALSPSVHPTFYEKGFNPNDYKDHMQRIYHYLRQRIMPTKYVTDTSNLFAEFNKTGVKIYGYDYEEITAELKIDDDKPIKYRKEDKPAHVLNGIISSKHKMLSYLYIYNTYIREHYESKVKELSRKEKKQVESIIRQINKRLPTSRPKFIVEQKDPNNLNSRVAMVSSSYKSIKS